MKYSGIRKRESLKDKTLAILVQDDREAQVYAAMLRKTKTHLKELGIDNIDEVKWLAPSAPYPPIGCPIIIKTDPPERVMRDQAVSSHGADMTYYRIDANNKRIDSSTLVGRFEWTYP